MGIFDTVSTDPTTPAPSTSQYFDSTGVDPSTNAPAVPDEVQNELTRQEFNLATSNNPGMSPLSQVASWAAASGIDVVDSAASSFNLFTNRGDIWSLLDNTSLKAYYERNKGLVEGTSALAGTIGTLALTDGLVLPKLGEALASSTALTSTRLWQMGARINAETRANMLTSQLEAAQNAKNFSLFGSPAGRAFVGLEALKGAAYGAGQEAILYSLFNNNDALYTNDLSNNLFWAGLGIGIGGAVGALSARAVARQFSNSDMIRNVRGSVLDTAGSSEALMTTPYDNVHPLYVPPDVRINESALLTEYAAGSRRVIPPDAPPNVAAKINDLRNEDQKLMSDSIQKINTEGLDNVPTVKGEAGAIPELQNFRTALEDDVTLAHGMDSMGIPTQGIEVGMKQREEGIQALRDRADVLESKQANPKKAAELRNQASQLEQHQPFAFIDNHWVSATSPEAKAVSAFDPEKYKLRPAGQESKSSIKASKNTPAVAANYKGDTMWLNETMSLGKRDFAAMPMEQRLLTLQMANTLFNRMGNAAADSVAKAAGATKGLTMTVTNPNDWFQLEMASEYARRFGGNLIDFTSKAGFGSIEEMRLHSLRLRANAMLQRFDSKTPITAWDRMAYNMPAPTSFESMHDPMGDRFRDWLRGVVSSDPKTAMKTPHQLMSELEDARRSALAIEGLDLMPKRSATDKWILSGNMFNFNRNSSKQWMRPILGYFNSAPGVRPITRGGLAEQVAIRKGLIVNELLKGDPNGFVNPTIKTLLGMPETQTAMDVKGLSDEQITGLGNALSQLGGEVLPPRFRFRDSPIMLSATRVREAVTRLQNGYIEALMQKYGMTDALTSLTTSTNKPTRTLVNQFISNRGGWDLEAEPVPLSRGMFGFRLADTEKNRAMLGVEEMTGDELLTNPRLDFVSGGNTPIVLDAKGLDIMEKFNKLTDEILGNTNTIRLARGLVPIERMGWYVPTLYKSNKFAAFTLDEFDRTVPGGAIIADSEAELQRLMEKARQEIADSGAGHRVETKASLDKNRDIWDQQAMDWIDPGFTGRPRYQKLGTGSQTFVDNNAFEGVLDWAKRQVQQQGSDMIKSLFSEQIHLARANSVVEKAASGATKRVLDTKRNIWDEYIGALLGHRMALDESSISGKVLTPIENTINQILRNTPIPTNWVMDLATRMNVPLARLNTAKSYSDLARALGPYTPYKSASDYAEQTLKIKPPKELRKFTDKSNWLAATMILRYLDLPQAMLNMVGVISTMPALLVNKRAPITVGFKLADNTQLGVVDAVKIMAQGFLDMTRKDPETVRIWNHMVRMGDTSQPVADLHNVMASMDSHAGWRRAMFGTGNVARDGYVKGKGIDGLLGIATDRTESWSRQWSHFVGYRLAKMHGIQGEDAMHDFAREIANAAIADYSPVNRPELFQSALGSMIGLFMTYMMNQNLKLFRWMENRQFAAFGTQLALQSSLFGVVGTPGVQQIMGMHDFFTGSGSKGEPTALDWLYARYGTLLGNAIAHGGLATLPFAFYTRGDQSIRLPALNVANVSASGSMLFNIGRSLVDATQTVLNGMSPENARLIAEQLTRGMPNRVMKGWLEVGLLGGNSTDYSGNIMADTRNWIDTTARILGLRSTRQQAEINAYYAGKSMMDKSAQLMDGLRQRLKADIRSHGGPQGAASQLDYVKYFNDYVKAGGSPQYFRTWIYGLMRDAGSSRGMNDMVKSLRNPTTWMQAWRYGAYGAN